MANVKISALTDATAVNTTDELPIVQSGVTKRATVAEVLAAGIIAPAAFTSRTLTVADHGKVLVCATAQTATVDTGLTAGFGCSFKGAISFTGTAAVTDVRTTGAANPWCELINTGTNTYDVVGGKA